MTYLSQAELVIVVATTLALIAVAVYQAWELRKWKERTNAAREFAQEALQHLAFTAHCPPEVLPPMQKVLQKWLHDRGFDCQVIAVDGPREEEDGSDETSLPVM